MGIGIGIFLVLLLVGAAFRGNGSTRRDEHVEQQLAANANWPNQHFDEQFDQHELHRGSGEQPLEEMVYQQDQYTIGNTAE